MSYLSDEDYSFIYNRVPRLCVDLLIRDEHGAVLLALRDIEPCKDTWHMPGGRVVMKESIADAVQRIAARELSSKVSIINPCVGVVEMPNEDFSGNTRHSVSIVVEVKLESTPKATEQNRDIAYFERLPEGAHLEHAEFLRKQKIIS